MRRNNGTYTISATDLASANACPHITSSTLERLDGKFTIIPFHDPQLEMLQQIGNSYERSYLEELIQEGKRVGIIHSSGQHQPGHPVGSIVYQSVADALTDRPDIIYQAELIKQLSPTLILRGIVDFLELVYTDRFPDGVYIVVDTKLSNKTKAGSVLQIAMYSELIEHYTGRRPHVMAIQKYDGTRDWFRCDDFRSYYEKCKSRLFAAFEQYDNIDKLDANGNPIPGRVYTIAPDEHQYCTTCKYKATCASQREDARSLNLVASMGKTQKEAFLEDGVNTIDEAANHPESRIDQGIGNRPIRLLESMKRLTKQASLQLETEQHKQAGRTDIAQMDLEPIELEGLCALPLPHADDVFLDFEKDKFSVEDGLIYLTGYIHQGNYTGLWSRNQDEERANFYALIQFLKSVTQWTPGMQYFDITPINDAANSDLKAVTCNITYTGPHIYAYSHAEKTNLTHLSEKYGESDFITFLKRAKVIVDLRAILIKTMLLGIRGYGLKEVESYMTHRSGFARTIPLPVAVKCRIAVEIALAKHEIIDSLTYVDPQTQQPESTMEKVEGYNEDDCRSLLVLRDILNEDFDDRSQTENLTRPTFTIVTTNTNYVDNQQRTNPDDQLLADLLVAFSPENNVTNDPAINLLYGCLNFYKKESTADWYKFVDLLEADDYDLRRNDSVLANYVDAPIFDNSEKTVTLVYNNQECDFVGKEFIGYGKDYKHIVGKVSSLDSIAARPGHIEVVLKFQEEVFDIVSVEGMPHIIMEKAKKYNTKDKLSRLLQFANEYKSIHIDKTPPAALRYEATHKYLAKKDTEYTTNITALIQGNLSASDILNVKAKHMNHSVMAVQGPPGTGKSYCIKKLVKHLIEENPDVKIAITANGHSVMHSLASSIIKELQEGNVSATILQNVGADFKLSKADKELEFATANGQDIVNYSRINAPSEKPQLEDNLPNITIGTSFFIGREVFTQAFDYVIVEEAGQLSLVDTIVVSGSGKNMIMVGDQNQLKSPIQLKNHNGAEISGLEYFVPEQTVPDAKGVFISVTRRMHPDVCSFVSTISYESKLESLPGLDQRTITSVQQTATLTGSGLRHVEVVHREPRKSNAEEEVDKLKSIIKQLFDPTFAYKFTDESGVERPITFEDVMIITPFNSQRKLIQTMLQELQDEALRNQTNGTQTLKRMNELTEKISKYTGNLSNVRKQELEQLINEYEQLVDGNRECMFTHMKPGTVDSYQGKEAAIVLYSTVCTSIDHAPRGMEFIFSPNRFNVSVSRAKALFVMIGSKELFNATCKTPEQMKLANAFCYFEEIAQSIVI